MMGQIHKSKRVSKYGVAEGIAGHNSSDAKFRSQNISQPHFCLYGAIKERQLPRSGGRHARKLSIYKFDNCFRLGHQPLVPSRSCQTGM